MYKAMSHHNSDKAAAQRTHIFKEPLGAYFSLCLQKGVRQKKMRFVVACQVMRELSLGDIATAQWSTTWPVECEFLHVPGRPTNA